MPACVPVPSALLRIVTIFVAFALAEKADADPREDHWALGGERGAVWQHWWHIHLGCPSPALISLGSSSADSPQRGDTSDSTGVIQVSGESQRPHRGLQWG